MFMATNGACLPNSTVLFFPFLARVKFRLSVYIHPPAILDSLAVPPLVEGSQKPFPILYPDFNTQTSEDINKIQQYTLVLTRYTQYSSLRTLAQDGVVTSWVCW